MGFKRRKKNTISSLDSEDFAEVKAELSVSSTVFEPGRFTAVVEIVNEVGVFFGARRRARARESQLRANSLDDGRPAMYWL